MTIKKKFIKKIPTATSKWGLLLTMNVNTWPPLQSSNITHNCTSNVLGHSYSPTTYNHSSQGQQNKFHEHSKLKRITSTLTGGI